MARQAWMEEIQGLVSEGTVAFDEPMSAHTTFRIGGPAQCFICPAIDEAEAILDFCRNRRIPITVIGNGSNLLVGDGGIDGVALSFGRPAAGISVADDRLIVQAGALLSKIANTAADAGLSGMEFAAGIPGSLGGAVVMNAGAYGGEMKDILCTVRVLSPDGGIVTYPVQDLDLGYRHSRLMDDGSIVLAAELSLHHDAVEKIRARMEDFRRRRTEKQPLEFPSAGSTFKRPPGHFAGKLIMDAGLAGYTVGGAKVSEKHCGFVVNVDHATAEDVRRLMDEVAGRVRDFAGVSLEPEVRMIGKFHS